MDFPSFGDAEGYLDLGRICADGDMVRCIGNPVRPAGIALFYAIPFVISKDPILQNYIILLFNLIASVIVLKVFHKIFLLNKVGLSDNSFFKTLSCFLIIMMCVVPLVPVMLSDLIALLFYSAASYLLFMGTHKIFSSNERKKPTEVIFITSGFLFAVAVLMKQNYILYNLFTFIAFALVFKKEIFHKQALLQNLKYVTYFAVGFSFVLVQFLIVYNYHGIFWLYDIKTLAPFKPATQQPNIELIAYNLPSKGAYLVSLHEKISTVNFYLLRLYLGLSKIYLPIYHGFAPMSVKYSFSDNKIFVYIFSVFYIVVSAIAYKISSKEFKVMILAGIAISLFQAMTIHVENRYYLLPRIVFLLSCVSCILYVVGVLKTWYSNSLLKAKM